MFVNRGWPSLAFCRLFCAHGLRLLRVVTTIRPPLLVTLESSLIAWWALSVNSIAVMETALSKLLSSKGRRVMSPRIAEKFPVCLRITACSSIGHDRSRPITAAPRARMSRVKIPVPQPTSTIFSLDPGLSSSSNSSVSYFFTSSPVGVVNQRSYLSVQLSKGVVVMGCRYCFGSE